MIRRRSSSGRRSRETEGFEITKKVKEQILAIRDTGLTNMFDVPMVQRLAYDQDFFELVCWLEDHKKEYVRFIMYGET